jgi:hypothetical protein
MAVVTTLDPTSAASFNTGPLPHASVVSFTFSASFLQAVHAQPGIIAVAVGGGYNQKEKQR